MNDGIVCIGVCINDPETGVCLGCGRQPEAVSESDRPFGTPFASPKGIPSGHKKNDGTPLSASEYPLPVQVADQTGQSSD